MKLSLAVWHFVFATAKLKSTNISYYTYMWWSGTEPPHLNLQYSYNGDFGTQPPNLIPANIPGYTVHLKHTPSWYVIVCEIKIMVEVTTS